MTNNETFVVRSAIPERLYVKIYHDFLDSTIINGKEKIVFILLKRYLNFKLDERGIEGQVYPTLETLSKQAGMTKKTVADIIKKLETKGLLEVKQQGLNKPNIYTLKDFSGIWNAKNEEELKTAISTYEEEYEEFKLIERLQRKGYKVTKEKEPESTEPTKDQLNQALEKNQFDIVNTTTNSMNRQVVRYTMEQIRTLYEYDILLEMNKHGDRDIEAVFDILYDVLNTNKPTIRVAGEDKPAMVVVGKLMKLTYEEILYVIEKYNEQTERINNPTSYLLTMLYKASEQFHLDISNQVQHDMTHWSDRSQN